MSSTQAVHGVVYSNPLICSVALVLRDSYHGLMPRHILLISLSCLFCACSASEPIDPVLNTQTYLVPAVTIIGDAPISLAERMSHYRVPAVSVAIIEKGHITTTTAIGSHLAGDSVSAGPDTQFQAASIGKALTAVAIMRLVDQGRLDLDGSANGYLDSFSLKDADGAPADAVTLRDLLTHSAGVNAPSFPGFERNADLPSLRDILEGTDKAETAPVHASQSLGTYRYSGGGFMVLEAVIKDVSGMSFEAFMQREVFIPLGMTKTSFSIAPNATGRASGHSWQGAPIPGGWRDYPQSSAAGLWSTSTDLARLLAALHAAWHGESKTFLSQNLVKEMTKEQGGGMGLGFGLSGKGDALLLSHSGANSGYNAFILLYPKTGNGAVVMTNGDGGRYLYDDILRTLEQARGWPPRITTKIFAAQPDEADRVSALAGTYRMNPPGFILEISCDADHSACDLITPRGSLYHIRATSSTGFHLSETGDEIGVSDDGTIQVWGMTGVPVPVP